MCVKKLLATFFGTGLLPTMPGTYASLLAALLFYLMWIGLGPQARWAAAALALVSLIAGLRLCTWAQEHFQSRDPRAFVLDEAVGQWIALLFVPLSGKVLPAAGVSFLLFRVFDVAKPFPVDRMEKLPGSWGVMLDDVVAAIYAGISLRLLFAVVGAAAAGA